MIRNSRARSSPKNENYPSKIGSLSGKVRGNTPKK